MSKYQENQNVVLGFIIGAAAGLAAGILLAPDSGEVTRQTIAKKATDLKGKANDLKGQVGTQINSTIKTITDKTKTVAGSVTGQNGKKAPKKPAGQSTPNSPNTDIVN
jgi:gas vesicle protein